MDEVPLSTYQYLNDQAQKSLADVSVRWPQMAMEATRAPSQLQDFLLAASVPLSDAREASHSARTTALREHDALTAEGLHLRAQIGESLTCVEALTGEAASLRESLREAKETLARGVDKIRGNLRDLAMRVADYEGVVWAGEEGREGGGVLQPPTG